MTALADLGLVDAADAVARREVSSVALLEACLARLDVVTPTSAIPTGTAAARRWSRLERAARSRHARSRVVRQAGSSGCPPGASS